jgi:hypothetical protein
VNLGTLEKVLPATPQNLEDLLAIDSLARDAAHATAVNLSGRMR